MYFGRSRDSMFCALMLGLRLCVAWNVGIFFGYCDFPYVFFYGNDFKLLFSCGNLKVFKKTAFIIL